MKKYITLLALVMSTSAFAQHYHHHHGSYGGNWIAPLIIGGAIGYGLRSNQPVYINSQPVYNLPTPAPVYGATPIYEKRTQWDMNCNCYVVVYNQIGWQ